jgi:hypothetical protein
VSLGKAFAAIEPEERRGQVEFVDGLDKCSGVPFCCHDGYPLATQAAAAAALVAGVAAVGVAVAVLVAAPGSAAAAAAAAAVVVVVVAVDFVAKSSAPYTVAPILDFGSEDFPHPFQQRSEVPSLEGSHPVMTLVACFVRSVSDPVSLSLALSFLPPACACPLPLSRVANCAWTHRLRPIARRRKLPQRCHRRKIAARRRKSHGSRWRQTSMRVAHPRIEGFRQRTGATNSRWWGIFGARGTEGRIIMWRPQVVLIWWFQREQHWACCR